MCTIPTFPKLYCSTSLVSSYILIYLYSNLFVQSPRMPSVGHALNVMIARVYLRTSVSY